MPVFNGDWWGLTEIHGCYDKNAIRNYFCNSIVGYIEGAAKPSLTLEYYFHLHWLILSIVLLLNYETFYLHATHVLYSRTEVNAFGQDKLLLDWQSRT